ncbi:MAG: acetylglutamate kinase [Deltaproteobacteria bacterium]|nr:acetylglutamate kinase [Deltaproteobacteria bacterium]
MPGIVVVKIGGEILQDDRQRSGLGPNLRDLRKAGREVVVVHGGGPQSSELQDRLGIPLKQVASRRIVDGATLDAAKQAVAGQLNVDIVALLARAGVPALGVAGASAGLVRARKQAPLIVAGAGDKPIDFGLVGEVEGVASGLVAGLLALGPVPVIAALGADEQGQVYDVGADAVAAALAAALSAEALVLISAGGGIRREVEHADTRIASMTEAEARQAVASSAVTGVMIPRIDEGLRAVAAGVRSVLLADVAEPGALCQALAQPGAVGTWIVPDPPAAAAGEE